MKDDKIICIVGKSGSGKTTLVKELEKHNYNVIHSYTTRKKRYENEWGHIFVDSPSCFDDNGNLNENIIAYTCYNNNHYWATREQIFGTTIYVIEPSGVLDLKKHIKDITIISVYLSCHEEVLYERMISRCDNVESATQRFENDKLEFKDFEYKADYILDTNQEVQKVFEQFMQIYKGL